jgi:hypothetical protein
MTMAVAKRLEIDGELGRHGKLKCYVYTPLAR